MSPELSMFENSFFSDPFSPFTDSAAIDDHHHHHDDIFETIPNNFNETNSLVQESPLDDTISLEQIASVLLSSSPPSHQLENLSLCLTTNHLPNGCSSSDSANGYAELPSLEVKTEEWNVPYDTNIYGYSNSFVPPSCLGLGTATVSAAKLMQRSYSSNCFDNKPDNKTDFLFQPGFNSLMESPNFQNQVVSSPEGSFSSSQMRKVCSTGDLQIMKTTPTRNILSSSPLSAERSFMEGAANIKVGRYSAEERKERIDRYRAKRSQRNFNKTIKYACRKTLADTRPRIRGRFARNDEAGEIPKTAMSSRYRYENEEDLWIDGFHDQEDEEGSYKRASFFTSFNSTQYDQYYSY